MSRPPSATHVLLKEEGLSAPTNLRVVIGEDDVLMRAGLTKLLGRRGSRRGRPSGRRPRAATAGQSALDPEVVARMLGRERRGDLLGRLTERERAVLAAMADGRSNIGIAVELCVSEASVEKHITAIFRKLDLPVEGTQHRRVRAVLTYMRGRASPPLC